MHNKSQNTIIFVKQQINAVLHYSCLDLEASLNVIADDIIMARKSQDS